MLDAQREISGKLHDFIHLEIRNCDKDSAQVAELCSAGNSPREISRVVDLSKTKVRDLALRAGNIFYPHYLNSSFLTKYLYE